MVFSGKPAWRDGGEQGGIAKVAAGRVAGGESATSHADAAIVAERAKLAANDVARLLDTPVPPMPFRAMQIRHDDTLDFTRRIQSALTSAEVCEELLRVTRPFGLEKLIAGTIPRPGLKPTSTRSHILFAGWPDQWLKRYVSRNYVYVDPVVGHVTCRPGAAFSWDAAAAEAGPSRDRTTMMNEAREHGLAAGFAVPFVTLEGEIATVSFGGETMDLPPHAAGLIHLVGIFAMGRAFELQARPRNAHERLSAREVEVLRWAAIGKTAWDVSMILGIAESTVKEHLARAGAKLGTCNKVHAVAEAMRCGLIN